jgi:hypothetical protein
MKVFSCKKENLKKKLNILDTSLPLSQFRHTYGNREVFERNLEDVSSLCPRSQGGSQLRMCPGFADWKTRMKFIGAKTSTV